MAESTKFHVVEAIDEDFDALCISAAPKYPGMCGVSPMVTYQYRC